MTDDIVFAEPPALKRGGRLPDPKWAEIAKQLSDRPGEWALIKTALASRSTASDIVARINRGGIEAFAPAGTFEATMRTEVDVHNVYARRSETSNAEYSQSSGRPEDIPVGQEKLDHDSRGNS